jgi:hypothetical protein
LVDAVSWTLPIEAGASLTPSPTVQASSSSLADIQVRLVPGVESKTSKEPSWLKLIVDAVSIPYYVVWTGVGILTFIALLEPHIQDIKETVTGLTVPFEQLMERAAKTSDEEHSQPTPKIEHHEKSGNPTAISSEGD